MFNGQIDQHGNPLPGVYSGGYEEFTAAESYDHFVKAIQATNTQTDHASLTGTSALRYESLEKQMRKITETRATFRLINALNKDKVESVLDEWTVQTDIGGQPSGIFASEHGNDLDPDSGQYERRTAFAKYMQTPAGITLAANKQRGLEPMRAVENRNAILRLLRGMNWGCYHADSSIAPKMFDGVHAQLKKFRGGQNIIDLWATKAISDVSNVNALVDIFNTSAAEVLGLESYGQLTDIYMDPMVQVALDRNLDSAYRVPLPQQEVKLGAPVRSIRTSFGDLTTVYDIHIEGNATVPQYARNRDISKGPGVSAGVTSTAQTTVSGSRFIAGTEGTYVWCFVPVNANGVEGMPIMTDPTVVAVNGAVQHSILPPAGGKQTGWKAFRSKRNPQGVITWRDFRFVESFPTNADPTAATVWVDKNLLIPGRSPIYLFNLVPDSIKWKSFVPTMQWPLAQIDTTIRWLVLHYGYLQLGIPQHHFVIENFVSPYAKWQPF